MTEFNPHGNRTADGVLITEGLAVYTNNLDHGVVVKNRDAEKPWAGEDHWYDVLLDTKYDGTPLTGTVMMNGERMSTRKP